ncbi:MAG: 2-oxoglutarate dehydrogenase complex dihydrolipoyllysine-residue succinyltransferase, partial [Alphaproteobacteria bacterium]|nr:2-oxoglutarate dehydrogenase complex dihydrolipoyllysine-residue succinyltransferase [Alphaproteobacteria bacterium]
MSEKQQKIIVPALGESVTEANIGRWVKKVGDIVEQDDLLIELETEKVTLEINALASGVIVDILAPEGTKVQVGEVIGLMTIRGRNESKKSEWAAIPSQAAVDRTQTLKSKNTILSPAVRKLVQEHALDSKQISATGKDGRITKEDVLSFLKHIPADVSPSIPLEVPANMKPQSDFVSDNERSEERVRMSRLRQTIAHRLKEAQNTAAILTTFNEVDMSKIMDLRNHHKDKFEEKYKTKLGFMSFFIKACVQALKEIPTINAEIDADEIVYKNYYDIGIAVGTPNGLVVPVLRNVDVLSFADIEKSIAELALKARDGKLTVKDLSGGTFTISNGGVYGSLMSTPILNPPQSGILGMHKIQQRPIAIEGKVEVRPMMYLALSYDHRIIDGAE